MKPKNWSKEDYLKGLLDGDKTILAKAITLIESEKPEHNQLANEILTEITPFTGNSKRIGISGTPGVGKSTFIESFGQLWVKQNRSKLAVLAIDPSSEKTGGSILGDKTRMESLSQHENVFIRPSPSSGHLGGVAKKTRESILLCEAAGYDTIFIESVGVGQSEVALSHMVDFFLLLIGPNAGDDLQGIKRGIMEVADLVGVNKVDVDKDTVETSAHDYQKALEILQQTKESKVLTLSALKELGLDKVHEFIQLFFSSNQKQIEAKRSSQDELWLDEILKEMFVSSFRHGKLLEQMKLIRTQVKQNTSLLPLERLNCLNPLNKCKRLTVVQRVFV
jgi:LAO/AO transport system kinase